MDDRFSDGNYSASFVFKCDTSRDKLSLCFWKFRIGNSFSTLGEKYILGLQKFLNFTAHIDS